MRQSSFSPAALQRRIACALGQSGCDLVLRNARIFNVFTKAFVDHCDVAIADGIIVNVGPQLAVHGKSEIDLENAILVPGFIDAHVHIESSMLRPTEFARLILSKGTTTIVADPHEIANVCGLEGIRFMLQDAKDAAVDIRFMLPSCVPATPFETSGASLTADELRTLIDNPDVMGLAEVMNVPAVLSGDSEMLEKLTMAHVANKHIDGHAPMLEGDGLSAYVAAGVSSDHECSTAKEALERISRGMTVFMREGSAGQNVGALASVVTPQNSSMFCLCTDDASPDDVSTKGHINNAVRCAAAHGVAVKEALCMATINSARHFGFKHKGAVAPGYAADLVVLENLTDFSVRAVFKNGRRHEETVSQPSGSLPASVTGRVRIRPLQETSFAIACPSGQARIIGVTGGDLNTRSLIESVVVDQAGFVDVAACRNLVKVAVIERHHATGNVGLSLVKGLLASGQRLNGALATTISHDSHNIIVAGDNDADMLAAVNALEQFGGGIVLVRNGQVVRSLKLEIAGLMTTANWKEVAHQKIDLVETAHKEFGIADNVDPIMALSFLALAVIPELRITDKGLFDAVSFKHIPVDAKTNM